MTERQHTKVPIRLMWILLLAFSLRVGFSLVVFPSLVKHRGEELGWSENGRLLLDPYETIARNVIAGNGYIDESGRYNYERLPLYTYFLVAVIHGLGNRSWALPVVHGILETASCLLIFLIAIQIHGRERPALWAAILYAVYFKMIAMVPRPFTEPLTVFLLLFFLYLYHRDSGQPSMGFFTGILLGMITLIKPVILLFPLIYVAARKLDKKKTHPGNLLFFVLGFALIVAPIILHNQMRTGKIFLASGGGKMLYMGTVIEYGRDFRQNEQKLMGDIGREFPFQYDIEVDNHLRELALKNILQDPLAYLARIGARILYFWAYPDFSTPLMAGKTLLVVIFNAVLLVLAVVGFYLARGQRFRIAMILAFFFYLYGIHAVIYAYSRYSLPLFPILFIFSAFTVSRWRDQRCRAVAGSG